MLDAVLRTITQGHQSQHEQLIHHHGRLEGGHLGGGDAKSREGLAQASHERLGQHVIEALAGGQHSVVRGLPLQRGRIDGGRIDLHHQVVGAGERLLVRLG